MSFLYLNNMKYSRILMLTFKGPAFQAFRKCYCSLSPPNYVINNLKDRSLISVVGEEAANYLQGLITNDTRHLCNDFSSQYAMFLNSKGRVLCDSIIYRIDHKTYFVECDKTILTALEKHLKMYRLRRKIEVISSNDYQVYNLFDRNNYEAVLQNKESLRFKNLTLDLGLPTIVQNSDLKVFKDPRVSLLGYRILTQKSNSIQSKLLGTNIDENSSISYRKYRYSLGIGEGTVDLPFGNCFPLESNCDYLHGVSFHKGCYVGQELTARTYHTGVTRKRLMPVLFTKSLEYEPGDNSITNNGTKLGTLRAVEGNIGLALLRIDLLSSVQSFNICGTKAVAQKPFWWPIESPKAKLSLNK